MNKSPPNNGCDDVEGLFIASGQASAAESQEISRKLRQLERTIARQDRRIVELEARLGEGSSPGASRKEIQEVLKEMQKDAGGRSNLPDWLDGLKLYGDLRMRYEGAKYNTDTKNRHRARFRLRFGLKKTWLDKQLELGFRLASGAGNTDPTTTNQTLTGTFNKKDVWIDLAYATYKPKAVKGLTLVGGKMKNPFVHTDMIWDGDVNPEGFWAEWRVPGLGDIEPFVGVGFFSLTDSGGGHDATLQAYCAGARWKIAKDLNWTTAVTYYDFNGYEDNYLTAGGNTEANSRLTAGEFNILNLTNKVGWKAFGKSMSLYVDYAHNCGNEVGSDSDAVAVGYTLGKNKKKGDWSAGYAYKYIEANSTAGGFNDGTFGRANSKGHVVSGTYNLADFLTAGMSVYYTQPVSGSSAGDTTTTVLADLVWKF